MASVRIEEKARADARFKILGERLGTSRFDARARMEELWAYCTEENTYYISSPIIDALAEMKGFSELILHADVNLAVKDDRGIRIKGTKGRIEWLKKARNNGKKGGRPKKPEPEPHGNHVVTQTGTQKPTTTEPESNLLTLAPAPVLAPAISDKNNPPLPPNLAKATKECIGVWGETLAHFKIDKDAKRDEVQIARLIQRYGPEQTLLALVGARFEAPTKTFNPRQHVSILRLAKPEVFDKFSNLGSQNQGTRTATPQPAVNAEIKAFEESLRKADEELKE